MLPVEPPVDISRDAAAEEAARELSKPIYHSDDSLFARAINKILEWISSAFVEVAERTPGGRAGLFMLLGLIALIIVVAVWRAGVLRTTRAVHQPVFDEGRSRSAAEYRAEAERAASEGLYGLAIRARFRACVAELTERTVLDERPGRTAYEVAADASHAVPDLGTTLRPAAQVFTEVVYGNRQPTPERYQAVVTADEAARHVSTRALVKA